MEKRLVLKNVGSVVPGRFGEGGKRLVTERSEVRRVPVLDVSTVLHAHTCHSFAYLYLLFTVYGYSRILIS